MSNFSKDQKNDKMEFVRDHFSRKSMICNMRFLLFSVSFLVVSCVYKNETRMPKETLISIQEQANYKKIGLFIDSTFVKQDNLENLIEFSLIDPSGKSNRIGSHEAIAFFSDTIPTTILNKFLVGKLIKDESIILFGKSEGLWDMIQAKVWLSNDSDTLKRIEFTHYSETPGFGAEISSTDWAKQFNAQVLIKDFDNFGLFQNAQEVTSGLHRVDGVSGATITSKSAINLVNLLISEYQKRSKKEH